VITLLVITRLHFFPHVFILLAGCNGVNGDGNIYDPDNISEFAKFVMDHTHNMGVHFMMADGVSRA
jgi:hypothetical protein